MKYLGRHSHIPQEHNECRACGKSLAHRKPWTKYCDRRCYRAYAPDNVLRRSPDEKERFEDNVEFEPNTGCWLWSSTVNPYGYGNYYYGGKAYMAHRYSYTIYKGKIPKGLVVRHTCDTGICVNPAHLLIGTQQDNIDDRQRRGRQRYAVGTQLPHAKLTEEQIPEIRKLEGVMSQRKIAALYGVTQHPIGMIFINKSWKHT